MHFSFRLTGLLTTLVFSIHAALAYQAASAATYQESAELLKHARELRAHNRTADANELVSSYVTKHPDDADALSFLAELHLEANDRDEAMRLLLQALNASPNSHAANLELGEMLLADKHYPEAMDRFETVLTIWPKDELARRSELQAATQLAISAQQAGNPEASLKVFEHARTKLPDEPKLLLELGLAALQVNQMDEAAEALQAARKLDAANPDIVYALARMELQRQHMAEAESDFRAYLAARPNDATAHFGLGRVLEMEQRSDAAKTEFERSISIQPVQTESYYEVGELDLNAGNEKSAGELFQKVIQHDANHGGALTGLGEIAYHHKEYSQAETYLDKAVKVVPQYEAAHYYLGLTLARLGRKAEADSELQTATRLGHAAANPVHGSPSAQQPNP